MQAYIYQANKWKNIAIHIGHNNDWNVQIIGLYKSRIVDSYSAHRNAHDWCNVWAVLLAEGDACFSMFTEL